MRTARDEADCGGKPTLKVAETAPSRVTRRRERLRLWFSILLALACAGLTWASAPHAGRAQAADVNAEARVYFERGNRSFADAMRRRGRAQQQGLEQALEAYVASLRIVRSRNALFNAAAVLETLERLDEAFAYYREYLDIEGLNAADRQAGEAKMAALRPRVAVVRVETSPPGASVRVDRLDLAPRGRTPLELALPAGDHAFYLSLEHYEDARATAHATLGQVEHLAPTLSATPREFALSLPGQARVLIDGRPVGPDAHITPGHHTLRFEPGRGDATEVEIDVPVGDGPFEYAFESDAGTLRVLSIASARVSLDGHEVGRGADVRTTAPRGPHVLVVSAPGRRAERREVQLRAGETLRIEVELSELTHERGHNLAAPWFTVGAGVATAVWIGLAVRAKNEHDSLTRYARDQCPGGVCSAPDEHASRLSDSRRASHVADAALAIAGGLALTTLVLWLVGGEPESASATRAAVGLVPSRGGFEISATFETESF